LWYNTETTGLEYVKSEANSHNTGSSYVRNIFLPATVSQLNTAEYPLTFIFCNIVTTILRLSETSCGWQLHVLGLSWHPMQSVLHYITWH